MKIKLKAKRVETESSWMNIHLYNHEYQYLLYEDLQL